MAAPKVLIVDDDPIQRARLGELASEVGFDIVEAEDGLDAYRNFEREAPDLLVTDFHMPRMDGSHLVRRVRDHPQGTDIPVMVVTSDDTRRTKIKLLQDGADDFVCKPVDSTEFQARLGSLARRSALVGKLGKVRGERDLARAQLEQRSEELERLTLGLVAALEKANRARDTDTGNHIRRVSSYAGMLARYHTRDPEFTDLVQRYAGLHDVGKVAIPDRILQKKGALTDEEYDEMKVHTLVGYEILQDAGLPRIACNIALHHHERWDGRGYPHGIAGERIPIEARLVSVADVFDALVTRRCYKSEYSLEKAREILEEVAGDQLDATLVALFFEHEDEVRKIHDRYADTPDLWSTDGGEATWT